MRTAGSAQNCPGQQAGEWGETEFIKSRVDQLKWALGAWLLTTRYGTQGKGKKCYRETNAKNEMPITGQYQKCPIYLFIYFFSVRKGTILLLLLLFYFGQVACRISVP